MDIALFTLVAIVLYVAADWLLKYLESRRGAAFENRSLIYFVIIMGLTFVSFNLLQYFLQQASGS